MCFCGGATGVFASDFFVAMGFPGKWIKRAEGAATMLILAPNGWIIPN